MLFFRVVRSRPFVNLEIVEYRGACDVVEITAYVDLGLVATFLFTWFVKDGSG